MTDKLIDTILRGWTINNRVDIALIEALPAEIWDQKIPGYPQKTVRMLAAHLHNIRCRWIKALGRKWNLVPPPVVDHHRVSPKQLIVALNKSSKVLYQLFKKGLENGDTLPKLKHGAVLFTDYMLEHEAHHRGQLLMAARVLGHPIPEEISDRLWQWSRYY